MQARTNRLSETSARHGGSTRAGEVCRRRPVVGPLDIQSRHSSPLAEGARPAYERLLEANGIDPRPSIGVSFSQPRSGMHPIISYAFILEPVAPAPTHILSFALSF